MITYIVIDENHLRSLIRSIYGANSEPDMPDFDVCYPALIWITGDYTWTREGSSLNYPALSPPSRERISVEVQVLMSGTENLKRLRDQLHQHFEREPS